MNKKLLMAALVLLSGTAVAVAQPRAVGLNLGPWSSISYEHGFGESNMLDVAAVLHVVNGFGVGGHVTYDWIDPFGATFPWDEQGSWHWYMGVGGSGGFHFGDPGWWYAGVAGHVGFEYNFWFPLQLSLDWRPSIGVCNSSDKIGFNTQGLYGLSLGIRYTFSVID